MKAVKINTQINLTTGLVVPSGAIAIVGECYVNNKAVNNGLYPLQVPILLYASKSQYLAEKKPILEIADFNPVMSGTVTKADYETKKAENLFIDFVKSELDEIYPNLVEVINLEPKAQK